MEAGDVVSATFHRLLYGRKFTSFDALEDAISRFTEETGHRFKPVNSHKLPAGSPNAENCGSRTKSTSLKFGCTARFTAMVTEGKLRVKALNLRHNHLCSKEMASAYPKFRQLAAQDEKNLLQLMQQMRPSAGRLKVYLKSCYGLNYKMKDLVNMRRRVFRCDPTVKGMKNALFSMRGGCYPDFFYVVGSRLCHTFPTDA
nr:unnamed protein product [Spirometra erinaceieuropaei]